MWNCSTSLFQLRVGLIVLGAVNVTGAVMLVTAAPSSEPIFWRALYAHGAVWMLQWLVGRRIAHLDNATSEG